MRILLAEDEKSLARAIVTILKKHNYEADAVYNGEDALAYLQSGNYDAAILDIMMPGMSGIDALVRARESGVTLPILLLTAKSEVRDKVAGLDSGANDYMTKPFNPQELLARIRAMTRSPLAKEPNRLSMGNVSLDLASYELSTPAGSFRLTSKERFLEKIWGYDTEAEIHVVWVYISYLRKKLASLQANVQIRVARNAGYSLEEIP